jgi:Fe2+ transport system protein FeoA
MQSEVKLSELTPGSEAVIVKFVPGKVSLLRLREMGVLPGTRIKLVRRAPLGDALEISVRGSLLSVRKQEAELIDVTPD